MAERIVVALGGNAIWQAGQRGTIEEQRANVAATCRQIAALLAGGHEIVVTHGNGPQVGDILIRNEEAAGRVPPMPLDVCGAESQGMIGYLMQQSLGDALRAQGQRRSVVTLVIQVRVDAADPAFQHPTKPIGPYLSPERAGELRARGQSVRETPRGWRRVVPSPRPLEIVEIDVVTRLLAAGVVVIAAGGGGVPVVRDASGRLRGVEAVIDKDLAADLLARGVGAETLLILTDVPKVTLGYGTPGERPLDRLSAGEAEEYLRRGEFPPGSMGPKVEAALSFVRSGGRRALITSLDRAVETLEGRAGTLIEP